MARALREQIRCLDQDLVCADAELHAALLFAHPSTAGETDFLFGSKSKERGAKRKRGPAPVQLGTWNGLQPEELHVLSCTWL